MHAYAPRPILSLGVAELAGYVLKHYWIDLQRQTDPQLADWAPALALAEAALPQPTTRGGRPGVGFLILHRGRGADYVVVGWWDRENELPLRVFVRFPGTEDDRWRGARDSESVCVWDLEVIGFERAAYVETVLSGAPLEIARADYLARRLSRPAQS